MNEELLSWESPFRKKALSNGAIENHLKLFKLPYLAVRFKLFPSYEFQSGSFQMEDIKRTFCLEINKLRKILKQKECKPEKIEYFHCSEWLNTGPAE